MYVLFEEGSDYACDYSERVKPFTTGIYIDDVSMLTKEISQSYYVDEENGGTKWYVDKFGMPTTDSRHVKPLQRKVELNETVDFLHYPEKFTKIDVMKHKRKLLLSDGKYNDCMMYEFNLNNFVNLENSENYQVTDSIIELLPEGVVYTKAINVKNFKEFSLRVDSENAVECYYAYDNVHYAKVKKNNRFEDEVETLYICFKNKVKEKNIINSYQVLLK